jgi:hypothetical protein
MEKMNTYLNQEFARGHTNKVANILYSILLESNELYNYNQIGFKIVPKVGIQIDLQDSSGNWSMKNFENFNNIPGDLQREFYEFLMGETYNQEDMDGFKKLDGNKIFLGINNEGVAINKFYSYFDKDSFYARSKKVGKQIVDSLNQGANAVWNFITNSNKKTLTLPEIQDYEFAQEKITDDFNKLGLIHGNEVVKLNVNLETKFQGMPPTILHNYIISNPKTKHDEFVEKYYDVFIESGHTYHVLKAELAYYEYMYEGFDKQKYIAELHSKNISVPTEPTLDDFLNFLQENAGAIPLNKEYGSIPDNVTSISRPDQIQIFMEAITEIKEYNKQIDENKITGKKIDVNTFLSELPILLRKSSYPGINKFKDIINNPNIDYNNLYKYFSYYKNSKKFDYLSTLKLKNVDDKYNTAEEIVKLAQTNNGFAELQDMFPISVFSLYNQLSVNIANNGTATFELDGIMNRIYES